MNEVIVGVDDSATARVAAQQAVELATALGRPLHVVSAVTKNVVDEVRGGREGSAEVWRFDSFSHAEELVAAIARDLHATVPVTTAVLKSDPAGALVEEAKRLEASIIVIGNKRVQGAARVLGSIAGDVAKAAPCNVFIVHTF